MDLISATDKNLYFSDASSIWTSYDDESSEEDDLLQLDDCNLQSQLELIQEQISQRKCGQTSYYTYNILYMYYHFPRSMILPLTSAAVFLAQ